MLAGFRRETGQKLFFGNVRTVGTDQGGDFLGAQGSVMELGPDHDAGQMLVPSRGRVPQAEEKLGLPGRIRDRSRGFDSLPVLDAVAIAEDGAVVTVDEGELDEPGMGFSF